MHLVHQAFLVTVRHHVSPDLFYHCNRSHDNMQSQDRPEVTIAIHDITKTAMEVAIEA